MSNDWDYKLQFWTIHCSRGAPPEFVLDSNKKLFVYIDNIPEPSPAAFLVKYAPRVAKLDINFGKLYIKYDSWLEFYKTMSECQPNWQVLQDLSVSCFYEDIYRFFDNIFGGCENLLKKLNLVGIEMYKRKLNLTRLKFLTLSKCVVNLDVLVHLAPNLETLQLYNIQVNKLDLSGLEEHPTAFAALKSLTVVNCNIDVERIIIKISNSLQHLKLEGYKSIKIDKLQDCKFPVLKSVQLINGSGNNIIRFLASFSKTIETLELVAISSQINFSLLAFNVMSCLKSLKLNLLKRTKNIDYFLRACPNLESLQIEFKDDYLFWETFDSNTKTNFARSLAILNPLIQSLGLPYIRLKRLEIKLNIWIEDADHHNSFGLKFPPVKTLDEMKVRILGELPEQVKKQFCALFSGDVKVIIYQFCLSKTKYG